MRLLCIANPEAYRNTVTDIPLSYARLAAHPDIELYHADTRVMLEPGERIRTVSIPAGFKGQDFPHLETSATSNFAPEYFDAAFCRTLKPFPSGYLEQLIRWSQRLLFVNDPSGIMHHLQASFLLDAAADFIPPSLLTANHQQAAAFLYQHGVIVAKRGNSCGGRGVYRISRTAEGRFLSDNIIDGLRSFECFPTLFAELSKDGSEAMLLMRFLPRVTEGDRRLVVVDGKIMGSYLRRSASRHWVQNISTGGSAELHTVTNQDQQLVAATCQHYRSVGIHILGYDLLSDDDGSWRISEINAGNIGGLFRLETMGITGVTDDFARWLQQFALLHRRRLPAASCTSAG